MNTNIPLFTLSPTGEERRDCTRPFEVRFSLRNPHPTFLDFVNYILSKKSEWGNIVLAPDALHTTIWDMIAYSSKYDKKLKYYWSEITNDPHWIYHRFGPCRIESATADGGWGRMDYVVLLEDTVKYPEFDGIDIPADFEIGIQEVRTNIEKLLTDHILSESEYNSITTIIDGAESRKLKEMKIVNDGRRNTN